MLIQPTLHRRIKHLQDISPPMRQRVDILGQIQAQFETLQSIGVDETEVELEHILEIVLGDIAVEK